MELPLIANRPPSTRPTVNLARLKTANLASKRAQSTPLTAMGKVAIRQPYVRSTGKCSSCMIISFKDLAAHCGTVSMVDGAFDPLHAGHVEYFGRAASLGLPVLCNLASDRYLEGKHYPVLAASRACQSHRRPRANCLCASQPIRYRNGAKGTSPEILREGRRLEGPPAQGANRYLQGAWIEVVYLDTVRNSSSNLLRRFLAHHGVENSLESYEDFVLQQAEPGAEKFSEEYFTDSWRDQGNSYQIEVRRKIEARNPQLIKEVFAPQARAGYGLRSRCSDVSPARDRG